MRKPNYTGRAFDADLRSPSSGQYEMCGVEVDYHQKYYPASFEEPPQEEEFVFSVVGSGEELWTISLDNDKYNEYNDLVTTLKSMVKDNYA